MTPTTTTTKAPTIPATPRSVMNPPTPLPSPCEDSEGDVVETVDEGVGEPVVGTVGESVGAGVDVRVRVRVWGWICVDTGIDCSEGEARTTAEVVITSESAS